MSRSSEGRRAAAFVLAVVPAIALAGIESPAREAAAGPGAATESAAPSRARLDEAAPARPRGRPVFRCWQYGRLIYEGPAGPVAADRAAASGRLTVGSSVQVYDLKSATCILEQPGG